MRGSATRIAAERIVPASAPAVFAFLADLENHWLLADRFVDVLTLERPAAGAPARGGTVRMRGPFGLGRTAHTRVVHVDAPTSIAGTASVGERTNALVQWTLAPVSAGTLVRLQATVERAAPVEAIVLALGGRRWLERRFAAILETLAQRVPAAPQDSSA